MVKLSLGACSLTTCRQKNILEDASVDRPWKLEAYFTLYTFKDTLIKSTSAVNFSTVIGQNISFFLTNHKL